MVKLSDASIESDHVHWCDDFATWVREINRWQGSHDAALAELRRLYATITALKSAARGHADTIAMYEGVCSHHAEAIAGSPESSRCDAMTFVHNQMASRHAHIEGEHKRIKEHHGSVMFRLRKLVESVGAHGQDAETRNARRHAGDVHHEAKPPVHSCTGDTP